MSRFRLAQDRASEQKETTTNILVVEDSKAIGRLLAEGFKARSNCNVHWCTSRDETIELLETRPALDLAVTGLNLPDAPHGEILETLKTFGIPALLFTGTFDRRFREDYAARQLVDYIVKDGPDSVTQVFRTAERFLENKSVSVLVVDDSTAVRSNLVSILLRQNFTVYEAASGKQAIEILDTEPAIQLVITDYHMPDMDGYELTKRIRGRVNAEELRIIGVSSSSDRFLSVSFLKAGASDFIFRPFVAEELQCRIEQNIETLKSIHRFKHLAERDPLTGLYNRRVFFERLHGGSLPFSNYVAILDIDHFKSVNDNFGHDIGDRVIQAVASQLSNFAERYDMVVARLGGEEFGILVTAAPSAGVGPMFEELRTSIEMIEVETASAKVRITVSIGISKIYRNEPVENFLNAADQLLYLAKNSGRNKVCCDLSFEEGL